VLRLNGFAPEDSALERVGKVAKDYWAEKEKGWTPDLEGRGAIASTLIEGAAQVAPSVMGMAAAAVNRLLARLESRHCSVVNKHRQTYDKGIAAGLSKEDATSAAYKTGLIEGFGETIGDIAVQNY